MLDLRYIRDDPQVVRKAIRDEQMPEALEKLEQLLVVDEEYRLLRQDLESMQAQRNSASKQIGELKRKGEDAGELMAQMSELAGKVKRSEEKARALEAQLEELQLEIPNIPHESVPYGESEFENVVAAEHGETEAKRSEEHT